MIKEALPFTRIRNVYLRPTMVRGAVDFTPDKQGRAWIPDSQELLNLPATSLIGNEYGPVVVLADGMQSVEFQPGELSKIRVFGNGRSDEPLHHYAFWHGKPKELESNAYVGVVQQCPGMLFDLSCGCSACRDHTVAEIYSSDADAGVIISFDVFTDPKQKYALGRNMLESVGLKNVQRLVRHTDNDPLEQDCYLRSQLLYEPMRPEIYFGHNNRPYLKTHDLAVFFKDGEPARLIVLREPPKDERLGFNRTWKTYFILVIGDIEKKTPVMRYHSECITADHGSNACDCNEQREKALKYMRENGSGIFIHAPEDGMDLGKVAKLHQTMLTLGGVTNLLEAREHYLGIPQDLRDYQTIDIVRKMTGVTKAMLASNNESKRRNFERNGIEIVGTYPMVPDYSRLSPRALVDAVAKVNSGNYKQYAS